MDGEFRGTVFTFSIDRTSHIGVRRYSAAKQWCTTVRPSSQNLQFIPPTKIDYERRTFGIAAPQSWNALTTRLEKSNRLLLSSRV
jgi:hypothetical protein